MFMLMVVENVLSFIVGFTAVISFTRIGGESVLLLSTTVWAIITAVTPFLANLVWNPLASMIIARFLLGLSQGES